MHLDKIESRLALAATTSWPGRKAATEPELVLRGRRVRGLLAALAEVRADPELLAALEPPELCRVVGDTNTQNVMLTSTPPDGASPDEFRSKLRFLDPRGLGVTSSHLDDPLYDWKFWHNTIGHYDQIFANDFTITHSEELGWTVDFATGSPRSQVVEVVRQGFGPVSERYLQRAASRGLDVGEAPYLRFMFLMASHFAAMMPFHVPREAHSLTDWKPLAMYCEAAWWMDACLRHWRGASVEEALFAPSGPAPRRPVRLPSSRPTKVEIA